MPYERSRGRFERASRIAHVSIAQSPVVREALQRWGEPPAVTSDRPDTVGRCFDVEALAGNENVPTFVLSFDGSLQEVAAREEYPSLKVGYIQVAGVAVNLAAFFASRTGAFVDPKKLARASKREIINAVLPGSNISASDGGTVTENWRREVYETFMRQGVGDFGATPITLLDALFLLHGGPGEPSQTVTVGVCPYKTEDGCSGQDLAIGTDGGKCPSCARVVWPTDILRTHEEFDEDGSNLTPLTRLMNVAERLLAVAYLSGFCKAAPEVLPHVAFVADGPLAFFGTTAKLKLSMVSFLARLNTQLASRGLHPPLIVGIEKSGLFVDHAHSLGDVIPRGSVLSMDNTYIRQRVKRKAGARPYGADEFYGRRFVFRTSTGGTLVVTVPRKSGQPYGDSPGCDDLNEYPTLRPTLHLLDSIETRLFPDAVIPIALAHSAAALPLGTGSNVLRLVAQDALGLPHGRAASATPIPNQRRRR